ANTRSWSRSPDRDPTDVAPGFHMPTRERRAQGWSCRPSPEQEGTSMTLFTKGRAATVAAFAALAIVTAACSSDDASEPAASDGGMASTMPSPQPMSTEFGAGCAAVPADGAGSFEGQDRHTAHTRT